MDREKNYLNDIFRDQSESGGSIEHQKKMYKEFLKSFRKRDCKIHKQIVSFEPIDEEKDNSELPVKLAAMSNDNIKTILPKHEFFYNPENNIALKVDFRYGNQIFINVIAESNIDYSDAVLFCKDTIKFYTSVNKGEYFIGTTDNIDINKFKFEMLYPVNRIIIFKENDNYTHFSQESDYDIIAQDISDNGLCIQFSSNFKPKAIVIKNRNYKDFIATQNNIFVIPIMLLDSKMEILLY